MKVSISSIQNPDEHLVAFQCSIGAGLGTWASDFSPDIGQVYDVEFDVDCSLDTLKTNKEVGQIGIKQKDGQTLLSGTIDAIDTMAWFFFDCRKIVY